MSRSVPIESADVETSDPQVLKAKLRKSQFDCEHLESEIGDLRREVERLRNAPADILCLICQERRPRVVFRPCKHLCCCTLCVGKLWKCPLCRREIRKKDEVFF